VLTSASEEVETEAPKARRQIYGLGLYVEVQLLPMARTMVIALGLRATARTKNWLANRF
jgi:hypothetical protein